MGPGDKQQQRSPNRQYILAETTWKTIKETTIELTILPWGATEPHNLHLPYATDNIQCDYVAAESARLAWEKGAKVVVLPTIPYGVNTGQLDLPLTININPSTQTIILHDILDVLSRQSIPRLVVMNGHGGNDFRPIIRELQPQFPGIFLCVIDWYRVVDWSLHFEDTGDHAGEMETSVMLHIASERMLSLSEAGSGKARRWKLRGFREGWAWAPREWTKISEDTGVGNPMRADSEKGRQYLEATIERIGQFLFDFAKSDTDDLYE